jgi:hypothetical protein
MFPVVFANAVAADMGLIPGFAIVGPALGLPLSVLVAFLERPFVTRAGFQTNAIWFSLQANFVSLLVGYLVTLVAIPLAMSPFAVFAILWPFLAVGISVATERQYLQMRLENRPVPWAPIAIGNVVSALTCIVVLVIVVNLRDALPQLCVRLREYEGAMNLVVAAASLALLVGSFAAKSPSATPQETTEPSPAPEPAASPVADGERPPPVR